MDREGSEEAALPAERLVAARNGSWEEHSERTAVLGELHARPFLPITVPRAIFHFAFMTDEAAAKADRQRVGAMATARGLAMPHKHAKYHRFAFGKWDLRWEQHTEFTTYTWSTGQGAEDPFSRADPVRLGEVTMEPPGPLIVAVNMSLIDGARFEGSVGEFFHPESLCIVKGCSGKGRVSTDFVVDPSGFTRILMESKSMSPVQAGRLVQRVLEIETYRTLALLGLPVARRVGPELNRVERELSEITTAISETREHSQSHDLLKRLRDLAALLEAQSAKTAFRFGATRAYWDLVTERLALIQEEPEGDHTSITAFFNRRLQPAIETCNAVQARQERLSTQLARTTDLLRTGIQFDLEQQNRDLLTSMDQRAKLQLRLQETVEGLSVAAISYYVVGLITYVAKGLEKLPNMPSWLTPTVITAVSVPIVVVGVWTLMHRVKKSFHADHDESGGGHPGS